MEFFRTFFLDIKNNKFYWLPWFMFLGACIIGVIISIVTAQPLGITASIIAGLLTIPLSLSMHAFNLWKTKKYNAANGTNIKHWESRKK